MNNYIIFTFPSNPNEESERIVPLLFSAKYLSENGWNNNCIIGVLTDITNYPSEYRKELENCGYKVLELYQNVKKIEKEYPELNYMEDYYKYTFIRWLVLGELIENEILRFPIISIGGDVILLSDPALLFEELKNKNFVLQGCPDFVVLNDKNWLENYKREFLKYLKNPRIYHYDIKSQLNIDREKYNKSSYKLPLRHDQDLIQFLIAREYLPQDTTNSILSGATYYWMQNPLETFDWADKQDVNRNSAIVNNAVYVGNKRVAILHMQGDFTNYMARYLLLKKLKIDEKYIKIIFKKEGKLYKFLNKFIEILINKGLNYKKLEITKIILTKKEYLVDFINNYAK